MNLRALFARLALAAALLTFVVIVASALIRHLQAGPGCFDWPACYGRITAAEANAQPPTGLRLARIAHRIAATAVLVLVIGLLLVAWTQRPAWKCAGILAAAALGIAAALAMLGLATPAARLPAVTLGNLGGGFLMLALLAATYACAVEPPGSTPAWAMRSPPLRWLALPVLLVVFAQATFGGMIGAQYALTACPTLGKCPGIPFDEFLWTEALDPFRPLRLVDGRVVPPPRAAGIFVVHRTLGIVVTVVALIVAHALRPIDRRAARALFALAVATPLLGAAAIAAIPSLSLTVLHNASAAALIAALAYIAARSYRFPPPGHRRGYDTG